MPDTRFCYLAQGRANEMDTLQAILRGRHLISLTWDTERAGSIFLPHSTWSQGRRRLCQEALAQAELAYVVFMDGDALTSVAELDAFEALVAELRPAVAVPRVPKTERYNKRLGHRDWVLAYDSDEQFQCFDVRILRDHLGGSPYVSDYDDVSWWYPCVLNQKLIRRHYWRSFVQINTTFVKNDSHGQYPNHYDARFILGEVRRLGLSTCLPLSAGGRFSGKRLGKLAISIDKRLFRLTSLLSPLLYRPFDARRVPRLHPALRAMIRGNPEQHDPAQ